MGTKLAYSIVEKGGQLNYMIEFICIYSQELFCIAVSYLQFIDLRKPKDNERCPWNQTQDSLEGCTLDNAELFIEA